MLRKRVIVCLDVDGDRVVKGTRFRDLRDVGDPVALADRYQQEGADEVVFLDISASHQGRGTVLEIVRRTAERLFIPLTVGGGVRDVEDISRLLRAGADKVSMNSAAVRDPALMTAAAERFGSQCVVVSIDAAATGRDADDGWRIYTHGGRRDAKRDALEWAAECMERGAGEILLTSIDRDGVRQGFDLELTAAVRRTVSVPVIASGGAGGPEHFIEVFAATDADAALAAGIFHDGITTVTAVKSRLAGAGVPVR